ncbi:MAG: hypothetical protein GY759_18320 [Chloroflexi bacterium]|nr:hypothetical protein [Chloroflexota bacterium]
MPVNQPPSYRVGPDSFDTDNARLQRALDRYDEGKGLIGGDPNRRPRWLNPLPAEPAPAFRLHQSSETQLERLQIFLGSAPLEIEIGCGPGDFIINWAGQHPERHFLAFEIKLKLVNRIIKRARRQGIDNLWISDDDARYDLPRLLKPASVDVFHVLFPDPWWKPRHQARRLFVSPFVEILALLLRPDGVLRVATDVPGYGNALQKVIQTSGQFSQHRPELAEKFADAAATSRQAFCDKINRPYRFFYFTKQSLTT